MSDLKEKLKQIDEMMEPVIDDNTVPRNIRRAVESAKNKLMSDGDTSVNIASAIYFLDDISNDINMPFHTRTEIWGMVSELEKLKEEIK